MNLPNNLLSGVINNIYDKEPSVEAGTKATNIVDLLNMRDSPGGAFLKITEINELITYLCETNINLYT
jgi:hypothetical protein